MRLIVTVCLFLVICLSCKKDPVLFDGSYIQFTDSVINHTIKYGTGQYDTISIEISLIGELFGQDQQIQLERDSLAEKAVVDQICIIPSDVTLNANESTGLLQVVLQNDSIEPAYASEFNIGLVPSSVVADNYRTVTVSFYKQKLIDVFSGDFQCTESEYNNSYVVNIQSTYPVSDTVLISNFWDFTDNDDIKAVIRSDASKAIVIPVQDFTDRLGNEYTVTGSGTYQNTGSFSIDYSLTDARTGNLYESGNQIYTPILD